MCAFWVWPTVGSLQCWSMCVIWAQKLMQTLSGVIGSQSLNSQIKSNQRLFMTYGADRCIQYRVMLSLPGPLDNAQSAQRLLLLGRDISSRVRVGNGGLQQGLDVTVSGWTRDVTHTTEKQVLLVMSQVLLLLTKYNNSNMMHNY